MLAQNLSKNFKSLSKDITLFGTNKTKGTFANKIIDKYKNSKNLFIITVVPNQIYCLAGYWIEEVSPGKFESIFYEKTKQKINEYKTSNLMWGSRHEIVASIKKKFTQAIYRLGWLDFIWPNSRKS